MEGGCVRSADLGVWPLPQLQPRPAPAHRVRLQTQSLPGKQASGGSYLAHSDNHISRNLQTVYYYCLLCACRSCWRSWPCCSGPPGLAGGSAHHPCSRIQYLVTANNSQVAYLLVTTSLEGDILAEGRDVRGLPAAGRPLPPGGNRASQL